ncbi:hypothetical protein C8R47DRAFT_1211341 [Mycena vitilis]|nr:hypothetical protein C8R47DRAFT_1211341 [Mycena vitilis]
MSRHVHFSCESALQSLPGMRGGSESSDSSSSESAVPPYGGYSPRPTRPRTQLPVPLYDPPPPYRSGNYFPDASRWHQRPAPPCRLPGPAPQFDLCHCSFAHPLLARRDPRVRHPNGSLLLRYDMSLPLHWASEHRILDALGCRAPAIRPTQPAMSLQLNPWQIVVVARHERYVTVSDVLIAIDDFLHTRITDSELRRLSSSRYHRMEDAYTRRCARLRLGRGAFERLDLLLRGNIFSGLSHTHVANVWRLHIS